MRHAAAAALALSLVAAGAAVAAAAPAQVVLIRHGEKPDDGPELDERGRQRARALVSFFTSDAAMTRNGPPAAIFAMAPKGDGGSVRAIQTVQPLADKLGLPVRADFTRKQISALADAIMKDGSLDGKTVVVCWEHKVIPDIARALGADTAPAKWPGGDVYDRAWMIRFAGGRFLSFEDLPEHVLPGDSDQ